MQIHGSSLFKPLPPLPATCVWFCGSPFSSPRSSERANTGWNVWEHLLGCLGSSCPQIRHPTTSFFTRRGGRYGVDTNSVSLSPFCVAAWGRGRRTQPPLEPSCSISSLLTVLHLAPLRAQKHSCCVPLSHLATFFFFF